MEDIAASFPRRPETPGSVSEYMAMQTTSVSWKSGNLVRLLSGGDAMKVIGCDSVGSVICRPGNDERHLGIYVPPSLLVAADSELNAGGSEQFMAMAAENA
jgi:hypothetical protein